MNGIENISDFLRRSSGFLMIDVRSESEFAQGHIPGAVNIPLLNDGQRKEVGTIYKQKGKESAVELGFKLAGPLFHELIKTVRKQSEKKEIFVYCWRGGMRSSTMAWILGTAGFKADVLKGGYKTFRRWALDQFFVPKRVIILSGKTGTGKTEILGLLEKKGEQVINLEGLANHKGSAFGALGLPPQPTNEQFENELALRWEKLDENKFTWIENESRQVGSNIIPSPVFDLIRNSPAVELVLESSIRSERILEEYGSFPKEILAETTNKLKKRLGIKETTAAIAHLEEGRMNQWVEILLRYYDKTYSYGMSLRPSSSVVKIESNSPNASENTSMLLKFMQEQKVFL